jgi:release factor glutamine methyltransferase
MTAPLSSSAPEPRQGPSSDPATANTHASTQPRQTITGQELLHWRRRQRQRGGTPAELDWLLDLQGGIGRHVLQRLLLHPEEPVELATPLEAIETLWERHHRTGEPLQYLVGLCPWRDLELAVGPGVLIPRQETELLVELAEALAVSDLKRTGPALWADLGTGSGCLAAALARAWPTSRGVAVDVSGDALAVARHNLQNLGLEAQVELLEGNWWEPLQPHWGALELVVANPPYIPDAVWQGLDPVVREHEPRLALSSGADGLEAIRAIAAEANNALAPGGWLLLEHHHDQSTAVLALLERLGLQNVRAHSDLEGQARFASARRSPDA